MVVDTICYSFSVSALYSFRGDLRGDSDRTLFYYVRSSGCLVCRISAFCSYDSPILSKFAYEPPFCLIGGTEGVLNLQNFLRGRGNILRSQLATSRLRCEFEPGVGFEPTRTYVGRLQICCNRPSMRSGHKG